MPEQLSETHPGSYLWVIQAPASRRTIQTRTLRGIEGLTTSLIHEATKEPPSQI